MVGADPNSCTGTACDASTTPAATAAGNFPNPPKEIRGPGGLLSQADAGNQLQLQDATLRAHTAVPRGCGTSC